MSFPDGNQLSKSLILKYARIEVAPVKDIIDCAWSLEAVDIALHYRKAV
jgi:hypothetical protein